MTTQREYGDAIVERSAKAKLDARAKAGAREFAKKHKAYASACDTAAQKQEAFDAALEAVGMADEGLDRAVNTLADRLIGNGIVKRAQPFAGLVEHAPSVLTGLAYAAEVVEAAKLSKAARKGKPPKDVLDACKAIDAGTAKTKDALKRYDAAQKEWQKACADRDALTLPWQKALTRYRVLARAALVDDEGAYRALFDEPAGMTVATRRRKKAPKSAGESTGAGSSDA